jgi:hypothetical protein
MREHTIGIGDLPLTPSSEDGAGPSSVTSPLADTIALRFAGSIPRRTTGTRARWRSLRAAPLPREPPCRRTHCFAWMGGRSIKGAFQSSSRPRVGPSTW